MSEPITCNLAENALDYLILAGEQAKEGSPRMTKHALATLADGVELLLKARLELRDWCLIFKDVDQASRPKYESGDFQSVVFDQAIGRLKNLCSIEIPSKHLAVINELRQLRNRIRHFAVNTERDVAISLITKTFSFGIEFVTEHLEQASENVRQEMARLRTLLGEFEEFVDERMGQIQAEIDAQKYCPFLDCPTCLQRTFYAEAESARCLFCGYQADGETAAAEWADRFLGFRSLKDSLIEPQIEPCPECGAEACVNANAETDGDVGYVCLSCGESGDYEHCSSCGQLHSDDKPGNHCSDCWQALLDRND